LRTITRPSGADPIALDCRVWISAARVCQTARIRQFLPIPDVLAWLTIVTEIVSSLCVTLGALVPIVSVPMVIVLLVAIFMVHLPNGFCSTDQAADDHVYQHAFRPAAYRAVADPPVIVGNSIRLVSAVESGDALG
jgi:uncharacterized membrane protein YphA (DoxX/SURF4 family)